MPDSPFIKDVPAAQALAAWRAARVSYQRGERRGGRVADLPGLQFRRVRRDHLIAGREDRDHRFLVYRHGRYAGCGEHAEILGAERAPAGDDLVAGPGVFVGPHHALAGRDRPDHLDRAGHHLSGVLDHHDRVRAGRNGAAGRDSYRAARSHRLLRRSAHADGAGEGEVAGQAVRYAVGVGGADGDAVHPGGGDRR